MVGEMPGPGVEGHEGRLDQIGVEGRGAVQGEGRILDEGVHDAGLDGRPVKGPQGLGQGLRNAAMAAPGVGHQKEHPVTERTADRASGRSSCSLACVSIAGSLEGGLLESAKATLDNLRRYHYTGRLKIGTCGSGSKEAGCR
jgi:hypothetical protein